MPMAYLSSPRSVAVATAAALLACVAGNPARAAELELESAAQLRHDYLGQRMVPAWQTLHLAGESNGLAYQGLAGLEWQAGLGQTVDPDIYALNLGGPLLGGQWTLGRQQGLGALRPQTYDGAGYQRELGRLLSLQAWGGLARHQDLDDLLDGAGLGRVALGLHSRQLQARLGSQVEYGAETPLVLRQDAEARLALGGGERAPRLGARAVLAEPFEGETTRAVLEWAQADLWARPWSPLELSLHGRHRRAADPGALFGEAILDSLAGGAVQEAGAGLRLLGARWSVLSARYALISYGDQERGLGHRIDSSWQPALGDRSLRIIPAYSSRSGPGGSYHALSATGRWQACDKARLLVRGAAVPFLKGEDPWDLALAGGLELQLELARWMRAGASFDAASDPERNADLRGGAYLVVGLPG